MATPLPADTAATGSTATGFATAILQALGAPVNPANVGSLNDWFALEGGGGANNPLNTTLATSGSTGSINSVGVQSYGTPAEGVAATVDTLDSGSYNAIVSALKSGQGLTGTSASVAEELSAWSGGGYSSVTGGTAAAAAAPGGASSPFAGATANASASLTAATTPSDALSLGAAVQDAATSLTSDISGTGTTGAAGTASATGASAAGSTDASLLSNPLDIVSALARIAKDFNTLVTLFNALLADIEWLFVPSNWVRIFSFLFGVGALLPGLWALMKTGSGQKGDITMALGILLVTFAGVMLFIAFHNLPTDVTDLGGLLDYISEGVIAGAAPTTGDTAFGPASSAAGATDVTASPSIQNAVTNPDLQQLWPKRYPKRPR